MSKDPHAHLFRTPAPGQNQLTASPGKRAELAELKERVRLREGLPFLFGWKWYKWAREFYESQNKVNLLCAANQISKSSTQIRKVINWATNKQLWPELWAAPPRQFWYLYPTRGVVSAEFETKWKQFLPANEFKDDPQYGWKMEKDKHDIIAIHFNSGVHLYFKTYAQHAQALQTGTCDAIFCFTAGHFVETPLGPVLLEKIRRGDKVLTREGGVEEIQDTYTRKARVITRAFSDGSTLTGTPDHRMWTKNKGYVALADLTPEDVLETLVECKKRALNFEASSTLDTPSTPTNGGGILGAALTTRISCTGEFGSGGAARSLRGILSTIKTRTSQTIRFLIWSVFRGGSTLDSTNFKSGPRVLWAGSAFLNALHAARILLLNPLRNLLVCFARNPVVNSASPKNSSASIALFRLWGLRSDQSVTALSGVREHIFPKNVYNINVANKHNYYIDKKSTANCDEELPIEHYNELMMRLSASNGYFHMVFTATLGQDFWRRAMEPRSAEKEELPLALKQTIALYDAMFYEDGSVSHWTLEHIKTIEARCSTGDEILKRVWGKFIVVGGRKYETFDIKRHFKPKHPVPKNWLVFVGADIGSGGPTGHPSALCYVAVRPDFRQGRVFLAWRGDRIVTTSGDVVEKNLALKREYKITPTGQRYDFANKDFDTISTRMGDPFEKADKSHERGEDVINTLFKHDMLFLYDSDPEIAKLAGELSTLLNDTPKEKAKDDLADALRYAVVTIPWDWSVISGAAADEDDVADPKLNAMQQQIADRRKAFDEQEESRITEEFSEWNEAYGND